MRNKKLFLFLIIIGGGLVVLYYYYNPAAPSTFFPSCPTKTFLGIYCPVCGSQRATHYLLHGDIYTALKYNPLFVILLPIIMLMLIQLAVQKFTYQQFRIPLFEKQWFILGLFFILCIYFIIRNIPLDFLEFLRPPKKIL